MRINILKKIAAVFAAVIFLTLSGCAKDNFDGLTVAVTISPQKEFVDRVSGNLVRTVVVVPPGSSPETYEITAKQAVKISSAAAYFQIGLPVEDSAALKSISQNAIKTHEIIRDRYFENTGEGDLTLGVARDHHIWLSIARMIIHIDIIAEKLAEIDQKNSQFYYENASKYKLELEALDSENRQLLSACSSKHLMTDHAALQYLAKVYGFTMLSIESGGEMTPAGIENFILAAKTNSITTFFFNELDSAVNKKAIKADIPNAKFITLNPLAENYLENYKNMVDEIYRALL